MAIVWMDGFEHYGTGSTGKNNAINYGAYSQWDDGSPSTTRARTGTRSAYWCNIRKAIPNLTTVGIGYALYADALSASAILWNAPLFIDPSGNELCSFRISTSQEFILVRGPLNVEIGRSAPLQITAGAWNHIECKFTANGSTSSIELRVNEVTVYTNNSFPIGSPSTGGGTTATTVGVVGVDVVQVIAPTYVDDLYIWDTSGSYNNDFIGDKRVATMYPNADTSEADWTPNSGATGYTQIDENAPDGDTSYVSSSTAGDISEYDFDPMPTGAIGIAGVMTLTAARKTDTGGCDIRTDIISNGDDTAGTTQVLTTAYLYRKDIFETDPDTGSPWTKAGVDAAKVRIEREV